MTDKEVRVIYLKEKILDNVIYRVQKGTVLQVRLPPELHGYNVEVYTNFPEPGTSFYRSSYCKLDWEVDSRNENTVTSIRTWKAGNFQYYFTKNGVQTGSGYVIVDPVLTVGADNDVLELDAVCCQTVFAKSLGPFSEWEGRLEVSHKSGYNMIHFTPIQELGASNSSYSISSQLSLNPIFGQISFDDISDIVSKMRKEWKVLSICDLVLNHTANETPWLRTNPECGYNLENSPHLRPAYLLDSILWQLSHDVSEGKYESKGVPVDICKEEHLEALKRLLKDDLVPKAKLHEMFLLHVDNIVKEFEYRLSNRDNVSNKGSGELTIIQDPEYRRLMSTVDLDLAVLHCMPNEQEQQQSETVLRAIESFRGKLNHLNHERYQIIQNHLNAAVDNVIAGVRYERVQVDGPKYPVVSKKYPLIHRYFVKIDLCPREEFDAEEALCYNAKNKFVLAHNGWVMNDDPLRNFALSDSNVYLRRELIAWGDSVKLRYGQSPSDCPFLWKQMTDYVSITARIFTGIRLDNCHSTPIHVAEHLLDECRRINPDLFVLAELFTNSDATDNIFVNRLGINSLIREALQAWDSHEEGRLVFRYGGVPVGAFAQEPVRPLMPSIAHALLMDMTHDNPSPVEKRSLYDILPTTALVAMASCASGSSRGLDEFVPHHIHVVDETRLYSSWSNERSLIKEGYIDESCGMVKIKRFINELHAELGQNGFNEVYVDQMENDIVAVTRHHPLTHEKVVLVAYTAFTRPDLNFKRFGGIQDVVFDGSIKEVVLEARLQPKSFESGIFLHPEKNAFVRNPLFINGLEDFETKMSVHFQTDNSKFVKVENNAIKFVDFQPGSVIIFRISPPTTITDARTKLCGLLKRDNVIGVLSVLQLKDMNKILYRCEAEERDECSFGSYNIPSFGNLPYCGLQGICSVINDIRLKNDLGHPFCDNLRAGNWIMQYSCERLMKTEGCEQFVSFLQACFECVGEFPRYLVPAYFDLVVRSVFMACLEYSWSLMSPFVQNGSSFIKALALGSVQCCGLIHSGPLPQLSPRLAEPKPKILKLGDGNEVQDCVSLSAGLPHFSTGYMRNWGRDTFISLPGLLLATGRFDDARFHILAYASVLRHGLIPNLLDRGVNSRYNCRDATWFWLESIKQYIQRVPNGESILQDVVSRMWPDDSGDPVLDHSVEQTLEDVVQESIQRHFEGISFRERNAGPKIDAHMLDPGFNITIGVDKVTGFVYGGNSHNCGTWMDKMGSSESAGSKGVPATPRDGSPIELVALCASVLDFLSGLHAKKKFKYNSVISKSENLEWTYAEWYSKIRDNFEKEFWIPHEDEDIEGHDANLINRREIYKDTVGSNEKYGDYQLRPNFLVAMTVAPTLFNSSHAIVAVEKAKDVLLGPLGMRTLDPTDWKYCGNYNNNDQSSNKNTAHGFNYHNGPEWLWPVGFYLRAYLKISKILGPEKLKDAVTHSQIVMSKHWKYIQSSPLKSLPELTNKDGAVCWSSCGVQAWSLATLLEVHKELEELGEIV